MSPPFPLRSVSANARSTRRKYATPTSRQRASPTAAETPNEYQSTGRPSAAWRKFDQPVGRVERQPRPGHRAERLGGHEQAGRREQPQLHAERQDVPEVAAASRSGPTAACPRPPPPTASSSTATGSSNDRPAPGGRRSPRHQREQAAGDGQVEEADADGAQRQDQPREVDLGDEPLVRHHAVAGRGHGVAEERPGHHAGEDEQRVVLDPLGQAATPGPGTSRTRPSMASGCDDGPGQAEGRLLVADLDVTPGQEEQQLAGPPDLAGG